MFDGERISSPPRRAVAGGSDSSDAARAMGAMTADDDAREGVARKRARDVRTPSRREVRLESSNAASARCDADGATRRCCTYSRDADARVTSLRRGSIRQLYDRYAELNIQDLARRNQSTGFSGGPTVGEEFAGDLAATRAEFGNVTFSRKYGAVVDAP